MQDDWRVGADLKLLYGVRYDLYGVPEADPNAPVETSRDFPVSKSNFAPRVGAVWTLGSDRRSVVRANTGIMYDQTLNAIYEQALQNDGTNARASANFTPNQAGAPAFPAVLSAGAGAQPNVAWTVDPDFKVARTWQNNVQFERAAGRQLLGVGRRLLREGQQPAGRHQHQPDQPDRLDAERHPDLQPDGQRRDARRSALQRHQLDAVDRRLHLQEHDAAAHAPQPQHSASTSPTRWARARTTRRSPARCRCRAMPAATDMTNLDRELGPNILDQRHTFSGSIVSHAPLRS